MTAIIAPSRPKLLLVDDEPTAVDFLRRTFRSYATSTASNGLEALALLRTDPVDLILSDHRMPGMTGVELFRECVASFPEVKRVLVTGYADLPEIIRAQEEGLFHRVLPKPCRPRNLTTMVDELLGVPATAGASEDWEPAQSGDEREALLDLPAALALIRWTVGEMVKTRRAILRPMPRDGRTQLEIVLTGGPKLERLRERLPARWRWPLKTREERLTRNHRRHPLVRYLGEPWPEQELYARAVQPWPGTEQGTAWVFLALLPWRREPNVTAAVGIVHAGKKGQPEATESLLQALENIHLQAIADLPEFALPAFEERLPGTVRLAREYDWVVTDNYVGSDRRQRPTSFLNRYVFLGRRRQLPSGFRASDAFVDRVLPGVGALAVVYIVLSLIDTFMTVWLVGSGDVRELNPLLRPVLTLHPWLFVAVKNVLSLSALFLVIRFQLLRSGRIVLTLNALAYGILDAYWAVILFRM